MKKNKSKNKPSANTVLPLLGIFVPISLLLSFALAHVCNTSSTFCCHNTFHTSMILPSSWPPSSPLPSAYVIFTPPTDLPFPKNYTLERKWKCHGPLSENINPSNKGEIKVETAQNRITMNFKTIQFI